MSIETEFAICCLEEYKFAHKMTCAAVIELFKKYNVVDYLIRINESLPKNATIEKESVVVYAQEDCPGDCPLSDKDVKWHSATIYKNVRQIQFTRYGRMTCDPDELWEGDRGYNYYVIWYREGIAYRGIQAYCDAEKKSSL